MTSSGFQSFTTPRDTFISQSTQPAINTQDGLSQIAQTLAVIEPALQKYIVKKIEDIKEEEVAEAQTQGDEAARSYTKKQRLLFPEGVEIDETAPEFAQTVNKLSGIINENDRKIYQGKSIWYKNAFEEAKAIRLGKNYAAEMLTDYDTFRVKDPVTGVEKPLSAYPFASSTVQNFLSNYRNKNVELAAISPFHFQRSFLPEIKKGTENFITKHEVDHAFFKLDAHKKEVSGGLEAIVKSWQLKRQQNPNGKFEDIDFADEKEAVKILVENASKFYQGKDLSDFYKDVFIPFVNETAVSIAGDETLGENRFDLAEQWQDEIPKLFPKQLATKKVINKDGSVSIENIPEPVFLKDEKTGELVIDEASGQPIQRFQVVENADGTKSTIPVITFKTSDKTVLETKQNYLKEKNIAQKKINGLRKDYMQFGKERELLKNTNRMRELLTNASDRDLTNDEKQELNEIMATSPKARTWLENNRNTYRNQTYNGGLHLRDAINNGQYRDRFLAEQAVAAWWDKSLKLPADKSLYDEMIGDLDTEIDEERLYAIQYADGKSQGLTKLINNIASKGNNSIQIVDTSEQQIADYEKDVKKYSLTKHNFGQVDANNQPVLRYPTKLEIENYADKEFIVLKDQLTSTLAALDDETIDLDPLSERNLLTAKLIDRKSFSRHLVNIIKNPPIENNGDRTPITLSYVLENYDIKDIDGAYFFDQYKNTKGEYDISSPLEKVLTIIELSDEEISTYGLLDVLKNSSRPENQQRAKKYLENLEENKPKVPIENFDKLSKEDKLEVNRILGKEVFSQEDIENTGVVIPQKVDEKVEKTNVLDETTNKTSVIQGGTTNDNQIKNPKQMNLSKVISDIFIPPVNATENDLLASGDVSLPIGAGENFMNRFNMYLQTAYGFDTDSAIYKNMPNYMKTNLMGSFQDEEEVEIAEEENNQPTVTTGETIPTQDISEVQSDMTPNLGLRDGSLIAMALPPKGTETKEQQDKKVEISKDPNNIVRMETNFKTIYALAKEVGIKFPEVVAAQFGVESTHGLKITGTNNYLGIKARPEDIKSGNFTEVETFEEIDGKMVKVKAKFKNFKSIKESLLDYKKHHNDDWFNGFTTRKGTVNVNTAEEAIIRLKENGYATDSDYVKLVTDVLNDARRKPPLF
tara:strand:+ start:671 stop:4123 length:3453 start_codon:yes stop_codon:yes gene_type:complete